MLLLIVVAVGAVEASLEEGLEVVGAIDVEGLSALLLLFVTVGAAKTKTETGSSVVMGLGALEVTTAEELEVVGAIDAEGLSPLLLLLLLVVVVVVVVVVVTVVVGANETKAETASSVGAGLGALEDSTKEGLEVTKSKDVETRDGDCVREVVTVGMGVGLVLGPTLAKPKSKEKELEECRLRRTVFGCSTWCYG